MIRRTIASAVMAYVLFCMSLGSAHAQVASRNPRVDVKHSDKVLFEQAQKAMTKSNYAEARTLLETLINSHPDSVYVPRAKLSIADAWYSERAFKQAELEYRDFVTFFPNRPEAAQAQRRIDSIHRQANF
jgi:outer membrane protein assembly factor BamD